MNNLLNDSWTVDFSSVEDEEPDCPFHPDELEAHLYDKEGNEIICPPDSVLVIGHDSFHFVSIKEEDD